MDDLKALNKRILTHSGSLNINLRSVLDLLTLCVAKLKLTSEEIAQELVALPNVKHENSLDVTSINKEYLLFARQTSRDIINGYFDGLIILGIDLSQARILAHLTNQQISDLARRFRGAIFGVSVAATLNRDRLHAKATPHYSAAMLSAA